MLFDLTVPNGHPFTQEWPGSLIGRQIWVDEFDGGGGPRQTPATVVKVLAGLPDGSRILKLEIQ